LRGRFGDEPAEPDQLGPSLFHATERDAERLGNPRGFASTPRLDRALSVVEAAEQVPEDAGDEGRAGTAREEPENPARDRDPPSVIRELGEERSELGPEARAIAEREGRLGPHEEPGRFKAFDAPPELRDGNAGKAPDFVQVETRLSPALPAASASVCLVACEPGP
jgi:hypothetical protein